MGGYGITTDETLRETAPHGDDRYPFQYYLEDVWAFDLHRMDWHWHREFEMVYVQEGVVRCSVGAEHMVLPAGSGLFINSGSLHRFEADDRAIMPNIVFAPGLLAAEGSLLYDKYVRPVAESAVACQVLSADVPWEGEALQLLREVLDAQDAPQVSELFTVSRLLALWQLLHDNLTLTATALHVPSLRQARLRRMMQFIQDEYRRDVSLGDIAAAAHVGESTALHIFQSGISLSPVAYLIQYRLSQAAKLLGSTQTSVTGIAREVGFASEGYFCRRFRASYHMTPNEYRRMRQHSER